MVSACYECFEGLARLEQEVSTERGERSSNADDSTLLGAISNLDKVMAKLESRIQSIEVTQSCRPIGVPLVQVSLHFCFFCRAD